jgi:hypothetical protein
MEMLEIFEEQVRKRGSRWGDARIFEYRECKGGRDGEMLGKFEYLERERGSQQRDARIIRVSGARKGGHGGEMHENMIRFS